MCRYLDIKIIDNKKVLLRERKRHTVRSALNTLVLFFLEGTPIQSWPRGLPPSSPSWEGTHCQEGRAIPSSSGTGTWQGYPPPQSAPGGVPPDGKDGVSPPPRLGLGPGWGYPPPVNRQTHRHMSKHYLSSYENEGDKVYLSVLKSVPRALMSQCHSNLPPVTRNMKPTSRLKEPKVRTLLLNNRMTGRERISLKEPKVRNMYLYCSKSKWQVENAFLWHAHDR